MGAKQQRKRGSPSVPMLATAGDALAVRIAALLAQKSVAFDAKRMMGGICFKVADKMCLGTAKNRLMVRFDPALHDEVLSRRGAGPMDFTGRPMRGYVFVRPETLGKDAALAAWIDLALEYNPRAKRSKKRAASRK